MQSHKRYKTTREALGRSQSGMALLLGLKGQNAAALVHDYEAGKREPSGPVERLYNHLHAAFILEGDEVLEMSNLVVNYLRGEIDSDDMFKEDDSDLIAAFKHSYIKGEHNV